jgi:hypothetical protein
LLIPPFELIGDVESATQQVIKMTKTQVLVKLSDNFYQRFEFMSFTTQRLDFMGTVNLPTVVNA